MRWRKLKQNINSQNPKTSEKATREAPLQFNSKQRFYYATFLERAKAQVIDTFMIYVPILYFLTYVVIGSAQEFRNSSWGPFLGVLIYAFLVALLMAFKGQTPGKKAYDLWVVRQNGKKVTFFFAFLRFFGFLISGLSLIGILLPIWRRDKKAFHDILFHTIVARKENEL